MIDNTCNTEVISKEIRELLDGMEKFITQKDVIMECIKENYLSTSTNN